MPYAVDYAAANVFSGLCLWPADAIRTETDLSEAGILSLESWRGSYPPVLTSQMVALVNSIYYQTLGTYDSKAGIKRVLNYIWDARFPNPCDLTVVSILQKNCNAAIRQEMRLGKFLRKFLSADITDSVIEKITLEFLNSNCPTRSAQALRFEKGESPKEFHDVYSAEVFSGESGNSFCGLGPSCMQGVRKHIGGKHPARAYGSGDFYIYSAWSRDPVALAARVIVAKDAGAATQIYASATFAGHALRAYVEKDMGKALDDMTDDLSGYRMKAIECSNGYLMPYLDCRERLDFRGDHFMIGDGDIETSTEGYCTAYPEDVAYCDDCEDSVAEEDINYLDNYETSVCDCCLRSNYTRSDLTDHYIRDSDVVEYMNDLGRTRSASDEELSDDSDFVYVDSVGMYVHTNYTVITECGECFTLDDIGAGVSEVDGGYYVTDSPEHAEARRLRAADIAADELAAALTGLQIEFGFMITARMIKLDSALAAITRATALVPVPALGLDMLPRTLPCAA